MGLKFRLGLIAVATAALAASGCASSTAGGTGGGSGGGSGVGGGSASKFCSADSQCASTEICHPTAKVCVKTCTAGSDCPSGAKNCALPATATTGSKVCNCSTDQLCAADTAGTVCSGYDTLCSAKCTSNSDCPASRACNATTGQCGVPDNTTDGGTDGGTTSCTRGTCSGNQICNFDVAGGNCETPKACSTAAVQPDTCSYAQYCSTGACAEIPPAVCTNFPAGSNPQAWDPLMSSGPVIWKAVEVTPIDAAFCSTTKFAFTFQISAYRTDADWPAQLAAIPGFKYVTSVGSESDATQSIRPSGYVPSGKAATFKITLCSSTAAPFTAGFYFTSGNPVCVPLTASAPGTT